MAQKRIIPPYVGIPLSACGAYAESVAENDGVASTATLLVYQCFIEKNRGVIRDAADKSPGWWSRNYRIDGELVDIITAKQDRPPFWHWVGGDLHVDFYIRELEASQQRRKEASSRGGKTTARRRREAKAEARQHAETEEDAEAEEDAEGGADDMADTMPPPDALPTPPPPPDGADDIWAGFREQMEQEARMREEEEQEGERESLKEMERRNAERQAQQEEIERTRAQFLAAMKARASELTPPDTDASPTQPPAAPVEAN